MSGPFYGTLIDVAAARRLIEGRDCCVFDCRFNLNDPEGGERAYAGEHLPGAHYAHLDRDLSSASGSGGRHPLPEAEEFAAWARRHGVGSGTQVVVYDDGVGAFAARLWWLFRWIGHASVAVLDGGLSAWRDAGQALDTGLVCLPQPGDLVCGASGFDTRTLQEAESISAKGGACLIDARDGARYRGEVEPFAPVAGHIPSAVSRPFADNCEPSGCFKSAAILREELSELGQSPRVCYCGSGVTACHNILAAVHAGLPPPALFVGSWSQWVLDPARPVATGVGGS